MYVDRVDLFQETFARLPITMEEDKPLHCLLEVVLFTFVGFLKCNMNGEKYDGCEEDLTNIKAICKKLVEIQKNGAKGLHSTAFNQLKKLVSDYYRSVDLFVKIPQDSIFYRMRRCEDKTRRCFKSDEMFHIPLNKRHLVKTQRYSAPGYPCLYISKSIYGCWEEMGRPLLNDCMVSIVQTREPIMVMDLRTPSYEEFVENFRTYIYRIPLIIACMMKTSNPSDDYKADYFIPQLLMEFIILYNSKLPSDSEKLLFGVYYSSVHIDLDFNFPADKLDNLAVPVIQPMHKDANCPVLQRKFYVTDSTYDELEHLKGNTDMIIDGGHVDENEETDEMRYDRSEFNFLERSLMKHMSGN